MLRMMDALLLKILDDIWLVCGKVQIIFLVHLEIRLSVCYAGMLSSMEKSFWNVSLVSC